MVDGGLLAPGRGALPVQLTRLFGREAEATELLATIEQARLMTLVGAPGCGKTRLAIELGSRLAPRFPDGVRFVDLARIADPGLVPTVTAVTFGVRELPGQAIEGTLVESLAAAEPTLVLLDNCEHVVDAAAAMAERLLTASASLTVLATSRVALGLPGEHVWTVPPLDRLAGVDLFVDRARLASSGFRLVGTDKATVVEICDRLDGLPLALELTAAWSRVLSLSQIADRLGSALPSPPSRRSPTQRHETMEATVDWSYRLLPPDTQRLFERLSVFAGGFDLEAAEAVSRSGSGAGSGSGSENEDVLAGLTSLVDHSLLVTTRVSGQPMRYRLLEPVRQCAEALLSTRGEDKKAARRQHAQHYLALARRFDPHGYRRAQPAVSFQQIEQEESNLLAAFDHAHTESSDLGLRLCEATAPFWELAARVNDVRTWFRGWLMVDSADRQLRADALSWAGRFAWRQGDYTQARSLLEESLTVMHEIDDVRGCASVHTNLAWIPLSQGDGEAAAKLLLESIAIAQSAGDDVSPVWARISLAWAYYIQKDVARGDEQVRAALAARYTVGNPMPTAAAHFALEYGAFLAGDAVAQRAHLAATLAAMTEGGHIEASDWLACCGALAATEGRFRAAIHLLGAAGVLSRRRGSQYPDQIALSMVGIFTKAFQELGESRASRFYDEGGRMSWHELVAEGLAEAEDDDEHPLTAREAEVAVLVAQGLSNVVIAHQLVISRRTVESHVDHIRQKVGLSSRHELMAWAIREFPDGDDRG